MNLNSRGVRRTLAVACSTVVVAAGGAFAATPALAVTKKSTLSLNGSTSVTALNLGAKVTGTLNQATARGTAGTGALADNFEKATFGYHVTSTLSSGSSELALVLDSYAQPAGISSTVATAADTSVNNAQLVYSESTAVGSTAPADNLWKGITAGNINTYYYLAAPSSQLHAKDTYITATQPGTYTFHFVDTGASLVGTDDDVLSSTITMTVKDAFTSTTGGANDTNDDWTPTMSLSSSSLKLGAPLAASVPLSALSLVDARSSSSGVGYLGARIADLIGYQFDGSTDLADIDLGGVAKPAKGAQATGANPLVIDGLPADGAVVANAMATFTMTAGTNSRTVSSHTASNGTGDVSLTLSGLTTQDIADNAIVYLSKATPYHIVGTGSVPTTAYSAGNNVVGASAVSASVPTNTVNHASTVTVTAALDTVGLGTFLSGGSPRTLSTATATYVSDGVTAVTSGSTDVVGSVKRTAAAVKAKVGTSAVTYTATVEAGTDDSGKTVYFTVDPGTNAPTVTADGTLISTAADGTKVYSALSNASGIASLTVTSSVTTANTTYTVASQSNGVVPASNPTLTTTYEAAGGKTFELTTSTGGMSPATGTAVTLAGTLKDQFGATFQPEASATQEVTLTVDVNDADGTWDGGTAVHPTLSSGAFSYVYTPSTVPTVGQLDVVRFAYGSADNLDSPLRWTSSESPASVTIASPTTATAATQQKALLTPATATQVTGSVLNASSTGMAYKSVTLTGSAGVYFSATAAASLGTATTDDLVTSLTVAADASGTYSAYAYFAKYGSNTITTTSGSATQSVTLTVTEADDAFKVIAVDSRVEPGGTSVVTGEVKNGWGYPVAGITVDLTLGASTIVTLGSNSVSTNADGVWSTTLTGASGGDDTATLTATINGQTANRAAHADWLANAGLTIAAGSYQDTATITVDPDINETTISGPASRVGSGSVALTGTAKPNTSVEIYSKRTGTSAAYALVGIATSEADGSWASTEYISGNTTFFAKTSVSTSSTHAVTMLSAKTSVKVTATALGSGRVKVSVDGAPNTTGTITLYQNGKKVKAWTSNSWGNGSLIVKTSKGKKTYKAYFWVSGYSTGSGSATVTVK